MKSITKSNIEHEENSQLAEAMIKSKEKLWKNILKYEVIFDASNSHTNCEHDITKYYWDFGDGYKVATKEPKIIHYYRKTGNYKFKMIAEANCPTRPPNTPNTASIELDVNVRIKNLTILKFIRKKVMIITTTVRVIIKDHPLFRYLDKGTIEKELSRTKDFFGVTPEEFYKEWKKGKFPGFQATRIAHLYEFYKEQYLRT